MATEKNSFVEAYKALTEISPKSKKGVEGIYNPNGVKDYFSAIGREYNPLDGKKNRQILRRKLQREIENFSALKNEEARKKFAAAWVNLNRFIYKDLRVLVSSNASDEYANEVNKFAAEIQKLTK